MSKKIDVSKIIGNKYGRLTAVSDGGVVDQKTRVICKCDCGKIKTILYGNLVKGLSKSCGCSFYESKNVKHGLRRHPLYAAYMEIKKRCYNSNSQNFKHYGGKGVKMCDLWLSSFVNFYEWSINNGWEKGLEPDRINNDGNYEPENVRWITHKRNVWNNSRTKLIEYKDELLSLNEWSLRVGIPYTTLKSRIIKLGWTIEKAFTTPQLIKRLC